MASPAPRRVNASRWDSSASWGVKMLRTSVAERILTVTLATLDGQAVTFSSVSSSATSLVSLPITREIRVITAITER